MTTQNLTQPPSSHMGSSPAGNINYRHLTQRGRQLRSDAVFSAARAMQGYISEHVVRPLRRWREEQARYTALMALDDLTLKDIGISRSDIRATATGTWQSGHREAARPRNKRVECVVSNAPKNQPGIRTDEWGHDLAA